MIKSRITSCVVLGLMLTCALVFTCALATASEPVNQLTPKEKKEGWVLLFNGHDFSGWQANRYAHSSYGKWIIEEGEIRACLFGGTAKFVPSKQMTTEKQYGNYLLDFEFKTDTNTHSGVMLRVAQPHRVDATGLEVQIYGKGWSTSTSGYSWSGSLKASVQPAAENVAKENGEWNHMRITVRHPQITVELNGKVVNELKLDEWTEPSKRPDGTTHKMKGVALRDMPKQGHIRFRDDHGRPISYRNIKLKKLD